MTNDFSLGTLLVLLLLIVVLGILVYGLISKKKPQKNHLQLYYDFAEELIRRSGITFESVSTEGFFGRLFVVRHVGTDKYGLCTIASPTLIDEEVCARFDRYAKLVFKKPPSSFSKLSWWNADKKAMACVEEGMVRPDGHMRMRLSEYLLDRRIEADEADRLFCAVAKGLGELHQLRTDQGEELYHGWLLPRAICIELDPTRAMKGVVVCFSGLPFALGAERAYLQIRALRSGNLDVDAYRARRLKTELKVLAPEQLDEARLAEVGPAVDFYAFGSIAGRLFAHRPLSGNFDVDWSQVPEKRRAFLQACLEEDPAKRPTSFFEY